MVDDVEGVLADISALLQSNSPISSTFESQWYDVEDVKVSESAWVLFTRQRDTQRNVVMKVLREFEDIRFSLKERSKRQECQLQAISRNRRFARGAYFGLVRINSIDVQQGKLEVSDVIKHPKKKDLDAGGEYALVMRRLPEDKCLERLLQGENEEELKENIRLLTEFVADIHSKLPTLPTSPTSPEEEPWGSPEQLQKKLEDNFEFADREKLNLERDIDSLYDALRAAMLEIFSNNDYQFYFEQRRNEKQVKSCHGDLKSTNIWMIPYYDSRQHKRRISIKLLDAIDFNSAFSNIDVLSDFAMLVVDVQARTRSTELADFMIRRYLKYLGRHLNYTDQQKEIAQSVLSYYLVEKAVVSASISILYDHLPALGMELFKAAEIWMEDLVKSTRAEISDTC